MDLDILSIDQKIQENFKKESDNIGLYRRDLNKLDEILKNVKNITVSTKNLIKEKYNKLVKKIDELENNKILNFYLMDTIDILEKYRKIIQTPQKISFFGKKETENEDKKQLIKHYMEMIKKYQDYTPKIKDEKSSKKRVQVEENFECNNCNNNQFYKIIDFRIYICELCGNQTEQIGNSSSYTDVSRVNISSKYTYERRVHFRDCINQYQGKQNSTVNEKVFTDLEEQFRIHGLLSDGPNKFGNITKESILLFLKELGYTKHYEDVFLIYYKLTGKKPDDISHLEQKLMEDFDTLSNLYDQKFKQTKRVERKNFINTQYVLYQLLRKYKHPCKKDDFNILKTLDRKSFHDDICSELFEELGWNLKPFF